MKVHLLVFSMLWVCCRPVYVDRDSSIKRIDLASIEYDIETVLPHDVASLFTRGDQGAFETSLYPGNALVEFAKVEFLLSRIDSLTIDSGFESEIDARMSLLITREDGSIDIVSFGGKVMYVNGVLYHLSIDLLMELTKALPVGHQAAIERVMDLWDS